MTERPKTGGVRAGGKIKADHIITGVDIEGAIDDETLQAALQVMQKLSTGEVTATGDITAKNIVTGLRYLNPDSPTPADFVAEVKALREQLDQAIAAEEITSDTEAKYARRALDEAAEMAQEEEPLKDILIGRIKEFLNIATKASETFITLDKAAPIIAKTIPTALLLIQMAQKLF